MPRWGRKVLEIRPPVDADKGTAVAQLLERRRARSGRSTRATTPPTSTRSAALDGLELAVRVAVSSEEAPTELVQRRGHRVERPAELLALRYSAS